MTENFFMYGNFTRDDRTRMVKLKGLRPTRDQTMLEMCKVLARRSTCCRRQVGCLLTDAGGRILSAGHNGVPRGLVHCTDQPCAGATAASGTRLEACQALHAEDNAIAFCADIERIDTCYVTTSPCTSCVKRLLNTSCRRVVFLEAYGDLYAQELWEASAKGRVWCQHV